MDKVLSTPSQTTNGADNQDDASAQARDFVLVCPLADQGDKFAEAVHALYYLPQNYKLIVLSDTSALKERMSDLMDNIAIMDRITFESKSDAGKAEQASPFSYADVVISSTTPDTIAIESSSDGKRSVTVPTHHPEAFASAVLGLARAQA